MLLTNYTLTAFRRSFGLSLAAFSGIYLLIDFFEKVDDFIKHHASLGHYLGYFLCKIPLIVTQIVPLAMLMGVLLALGGLSRNNELTAMRACGMSLTRIALPLLATGFAISLVVMVANEWLVPQTTRKANHIFNVELEGPNLLAYKNKVWLRDNSSIVNIRMILLDQNLLALVTIHQLDSRNRPLSRIDASRAVYRDGRWQGEEVTVSRFEAQSGDILSVEKHATLPLPLSKSPEDFKSTVTRNEEMGVRELARMAEQVRSEGYDPVRYLVDMHGRLATPFASFIMAFLGIPFALQRGRGSNLASGIAISVVIGITFHLFQGIMLAFGYSGALPVVAAAWTPNLFFGILGIGMLRLTRQ